MRNTEVLSEADLAAMVDIGSPAEIEETAHDSDHFEVWVDDGDTKVQFSYHYGDADSDLLILRALPITEHPARPYEAGRNAALMNASGAHILSIGNLSTRGSSNLSREQIRELNRAQNYKPNSGMPWMSTFDSVGETLGAATKQALWLTNFDEPKLREMTVVADFLSLGNNVGAALLGKLEGAAHPDIVIWREMVDKGMPVDQREFQQEFARHGNDRMKDYRDRNRQLAPSRHDRLLVGAARFAMNPMANFRHYPVGIAGGSVSGDMRDAFQEGKLSSDTVHVTVTGQESVVAGTGRAIGHRHIIEHQIGSPTAGLEVEGATHLAYNAYDLNAAMVMRAMQLAEDA